MTNEKVDELIDQLPLDSQTVDEHIQQLQQQIIIHSIIYYTLDANIWSDNHFDGKCKELVQFMNNYPEEFCQSKFYKEFKDFTGSTGYNLADNEKLYGVAVQLLAYHEDELGLTAR